MNENKLCQLLRQAMQDMELMKERLRCQPEDCMSCPVKTDCECDSVLHWVHAESAMKLMTEQRENR